MRICLSIVLLLFSIQQHAQTILPYRVAREPWTETLGNHRVVIVVKENGEAVLAQVPWRRHDDHPDQKRLIVTDSAGREISDIFRVKTDREEGIFVFRPRYGPGLYYVYYMPWQGKKNSGWFEGDYLKPENTPEAAWVEANNLGALRSGSQKPKLPYAKVIAIESRTAFDSFYPMEVIATKAEERLLLQKHKNVVMLFPEDRRYPIRMQHDIPYRWVSREAANAFTGTADRNEYYTFQGGAWAPVKEVQRLKITYDNAPFPVTCINAEGKDSRGKYFRKQIDIAKGDVQALWFGVDIPENAKAGNYNFTIQLSADGIPVQAIRVRLRVTGNVIADRGDDERWRHSRLRWLNSTRGIEDAPIAPYTALKVQSRSVSGVSGAVMLGDDGLPRSITARGTAILNQPVAFVVETGEGIQSLLPSGFTFTHTAGGKVSWKASAESPSIAVVCEGTMESDGYLHYNLSCSFKKDITVKDIRMELPVKKDIAQYFMGMGLPGMNEPDRYDWKWKGPQDAYWTGNTHAGIYCELRGATYSGPLLNLYHPAPPAAWYNNDNGGFTIRTEGQTVTHTTYSGTRELKAGDSLRFEFVLLITPVKPLDPRPQFVNRYYHNGGLPLPGPEDLEKGIKIINIHHANAVNPYINYPFTTADTIRAVTDHFHRLGIKVKLYYTIRELTNQVTELWALRSLGTEIFAGGRGGGYTWLREHLQDNYTPQWFTNIIGYPESDAALLTSGDSRWYNYYIEGLYWLVKHTGIDGLYLDDVAFDREMLKRMRRVMNEVKPGCLIDLHSNTGFSKGPATQYTEYFPYIDKLWFGESFQYNKMSPANWLVETSGIPFGLMGDMLQGGGNPWRGMIYGMTSRYPWKTDGVICEPQNIWKLWDDFGIADADMVGYWSERPLVTSSNPDVLVTAYRKNNKLLVSVASWAKDTVGVHLNIDWERVGWKPSQVLFRATPIQNFQPSAQWKEGDILLIAPQQGWLLETDRDPGKE